MNTGNHAVRLAAAGALLLIVILGLGSRMEPMRSIPILGTYFGDAAWAAAAYASIRFLFPKASIGVVLAGAIGLSFLVECSQLWHPAWLEELRTHRIVRLLIGTGFVWFDFIAYTIGSLLTAGIELVARRMMTKETS